MSPPILLQPIYEDYCVNKNRIHIMLYYIILLQCVSFVRADRNPFADLHQLLYFNAILLDILLYISVA